MLLNEMIEFCNSNYSSQDTSHICCDCNHPDECSGSCKDCLEQIHYPNRYSNGKTDYDCENLINFYVCDYAYKYASEILYLIRKCRILESFEEYRVLSLGCGACPDLMAFEELIAISGEEKKIKYLGVDKNNLWFSVHEEIKRYGLKNNLSVNFAYEDIVNYLYAGKNIRGANVLVLQYIISHFYNTGQIGMISVFFDGIIQHIIKNKRQGSQFVILINDVNSFYRGRDYFEKLYKKILDAGYEATCNKYYFNYNIKNEKQRYGVMHRSAEILFNIPNEIYSYEPWEICSSAQMIIEIE